MSAASLATLLLLLLMLPIAVAGAAVQTHQCYLAYLAVDREPPWWLAILEQFCAPDDFEG